MDATFSFSVHNSKLLRAVPPCPPRRFPLPKPEPEFCTYTICPEKPDAPPEIIPELLGVPVRIIAADSNGSYFAVTTDGTVFSWGENRHGICGHGTETPIPRPTIMKGLSDVQKISVAHAALFLTAAGDVYACGENSDGALGTGDTKNRSFPVILLGLEGEECVDISTGGYVSAAATTDGRLYCWGHLHRGGHPVLTPTPIQATSCTKIVAVSAGTFWITALDEIGRVWATMKWTFGEIEIMQQLKHENISDIFSVFNASWAIAEDGRVFAFGKSETGILGTGDNRRSQHEHLEVWPAPLISQHRPVRMYGSPHNLCWTMAGLITDSGDVFFWKDNRPFPIEVTRFEKLNVYSVAMHTRHESMGNLILMSCGVEEPMRQRRLSKRMLDPVYTHPTVTVELPSSKGVVVGSPVTVHVTGFFSIPGGDNYVVLKRAGQEFAPILDRDELKKDSWAPCPGTSVSVLTRQNGTLVAG